MPHTVHNAAPYQPTWSKKDNFYNPDIILGSFAILAMFANQISFAIFGWQFWQYFTLVTNFNNLEKRDPWTYVSVKRPQLKSWQSQWQQFLRSLSYVLCVFKKPIFSVIFIDYQHSNSMNCEKQPDEKLKLFQNIKRIVLIFHHCNLFWKFMLTFSSNTDIWWFDPSKTIYSIEYLIWNWKDCLLNILLSPNTLI